MSKAVKIYVVDDDGNGLYGQKVYEYNGDSGYTNKDGFFMLTLEGSDTTIYVNGFTAYDGSVSRLGKKETFTKSGGRP